MSDMGVIGNGLIPKEANGGIPVNVQDQVSDIVDLYLHVQKSEGKLIAVDANIGDTDITLTGGHGVVVNDLLCFKEGVKFYQGTVLAVAVNVITLDTPLDTAYTTAADVCVGDRNLNKDGSSTQQIAHLKPAAGTRWDVVRILFYIQDNTDMDDSRFGGIVGGLTNGIVLRVKNSVNKNIFNVKTNAGFAIRAYDTEYTDKAPAGSYGFRCRRTFGGQSKNGVVIRLDGDLNDEIQLLIRDDLSSLEYLIAVVQGHVVFD